MKKRPLFVSALLAIMALAIVAPLYAAEVTKVLGEKDLYFNPKAQKPISLTLNDGTLLRTTGETDVFPKNFKNYKVVISRRGEQPVSVSIPSEVVQINSLIPAPGNQVVVIGMSSGLVYDVVLIDVLRYEIADHFWAYDPTPSPNGRFIVFIKFYPAHMYGPPYPEGASPSDFVMIYDTTLGPTGNRPASIVIDDKLQYKIDVGKVVYPPGFKTQDDNTALPEADANHAGGFTWTEDSRKFVFSSEHQLKNEQAVTRIIRGKSVEVPKAEVSLVLVDMASPRSPIVKVFQADVCVGLCIEPLISVEFGTNNLKAHLGVDPKKRTIEVRCDQFISP
jgi:hypothetical protein